MMASLPAEEAEKLKQAINVDGVIEELIPLYDRHFTAQELNAYIDFYSSAQGQKLLQAIPRSMQESVQVSMDYFKKKLPGLAGGAQESP
jgi:hypothetical protein